jgi:hypothetical protein
LVLEVLLVLLIRLLLRHLLAPLAPLALLVLLVLPVQLHPLDHYKCTDLKKFHLHLIFRLYLYHFQAEAEHHQMHN